MSRIFLVLVSVVGFGQVAWGQAPVVVENHLVTEMPNFQFPTGPFDYMDFPQSKRTITVPAARASIVWSVTMASNQQPTRVRPVIGPNFPEDGIQNLESTNDGNWAASVEGGTIDVGLQVRSLNDPGAGFTLNPSNSLSWTLTVFPDPVVGSVPAVSSWGVAIMALLLIGGACVMLRRVRVPHRLVVLGSMAVLGSGAEPTIADFSAGFEQPRYQVGALYGQEGWRPEFRNENGAATVQNALGNSGQAIQSTASPMFVPNTNVVRSRQTSLLTVTGFSRRLMTASVDLFIPEAWTEPAANGADYGYSTGIVLNWGPSTTSPGGGAGITGNVQSVFSGNPSGFEGWSTSNNFVQQSLPTDEWFNLAIQVDFELGQITSFLDGTPISSFAAPEVILPSDGLGVLELRHGRTVFNDVTATPASASVFFDNASVVGSGSFPGVEPIPAPGALLLATLGLGLLGCCKRRLG